MSYSYQQNYPGAGGPGGYSHPPPPPPPGYGQYAASLPQQQQQPWGAMNYNAPPPPPGQATNWQAYPPYNNHQAPPPPPPPPPPGTYPSPGGYGGSAGGQQQSPNHGHGHGHFNTTPGNINNSPFAQGSGAAAAGVAAPGGPAAAAPIEISYPYLPTGKRQMTIFTPDRSQAIFTVRYPDTLSFSWSKSRNMSILDGAGGQKIGGAEFHSFTTDKVDLSFRGKSYHFKKKFVSQTGLLSVGGAGKGTGEFTWSVENGELWLTAVLAEKEKKETSPPPPILARFVPREGTVGGTKIVEGRLEVRMLGLSEDQFGEVFVTLVAEMERVRKDTEEEEIVAENMFVL